MQPEVSVELQLAVGELTVDAAHIFSVESWIEVSTGELAVNAALVAETTQDTAGGTVATAAVGEQQIPSVRLQCSQGFHWGAAW